MADSRVEIVTERSPDAFAKRINEFLAEGGWRVANTEMSVTDCHYWAFLIQERSRADE